MHTCSYKYSTSGIYHVPEETDHAGCLQYIRSLPLQTLPEIFGLHENADITKDNKETHEVNIFILIYFIIT